MYVVFQGLRSWSFVITRLVECFGHRRIDNQNHRKRGLLNIEGEVGVEHCRVFFRLVRGNDYISRAFRRNGDNAPSYPEVSL